MSSVTQKRPSRKSPQTYAIPALEKGLDALELLSQARRGMGLNEIAGTLDRSRQELFRVVTCLAMRGYLLRDAAGDYRLSSKMLEVGSRHFAQQALVSQAMPAMESLAESIGESCQLSLVGQERLLVAATAVGSSLLQLEVKVGSSIPLYNSVIGLVAIAFVSHDGDRVSWDRRQEIQRAGGDVFEPSLRRFAQWRDRLATIRRDGYLAAQSPNHSGSRVHAGPLLTVAGKLAAILSLTRVVAVREDRRRDSTISSALAASCRTISSRLGAAEGAEILDGEPATPRRRSWRSDRNGKSGQ